MQTKEEFIKILRVNKENKFLNIYASLISKINIDKKYILEDEYYSNIDEKSFSYEVNFCDVEKELRNIFNNKEISGDIFEKGYSIKVILNKREKDESNYIVVTFRKYKKLYFDNDHVYVSSLEKIFSIIINEDLSIFTNEIKGKLLPATLSSLSSILSSFDSALERETFNKIIYELFDIVSQKNMLVKEIKTEYIDEHIFLPIKINDLTNYHNKRDLIQAYLKKEKVPKMINKFSLQKGYILIKCKRYVKENEFQKLYILKDIEFKPWRILKHNIVVFFFEYYKIVLNLTDDELGYETLIRDYIGMGMSGKKLFNIKIKSLKRLKNEHDKLSIELRQKETKTIKIPKNSKFKKLKLGSDFEEIKTKKRIVYESIIQNNCGWSYAESINKDRCRIFSTIFEGKRYTLEIRKRKNKFALVQLRGECNSSAPIELHEKIKIILKEIK